VNETFISVTHLPASRRRAIAKRFGLQLDWVTVSGQRRWMLTLPGRLCGRGIEREIEAAVDARS
jgi:hypothetical protein